MLQIYYLPDDRLIAPEQAFTILDASLEAEIPHTHVCGGNARCSTCRVLITEGLECCAPRTIAEQELAERLHLEPCVRLACQTALQGQGKISLRRLSLDADDIVIFHDQASGRAASFIGQEKKLAILFADIRGFTSFSETLLPYDVIHILNRYFQRMGEVIHRHHGMINVYMGDGLMALFGLENGDRAAEQAIRAGVEMLVAVEQMNPLMNALYQHSLRIGIGVHYGTTVIGTIGDPKNSQWTAIGDAVNLASRIEAANKPLGTAFLISEAAYMAAAPQVQIERQFQVQIPGKSGEYRLYEVAGVALPPAADYWQTGSLPVSRSGTERTVAWLVDVIRSLKKLLRLA